MDHSELERDTKLIFDAIFQGRDCVEISGSTYPIEITQSGQRKVIIEDYFFTEQAKGERHWAKMAKDGHQIIWVRRKTGHNLARMVDGDFYMFCQDPIRVIVKFYVMKQDFRETTRGSEIGWVGSGWNKKQDPTPEEVRTYYSLIRTFEFNHGSDDAPIPPLHISASLRWRWWRYSAPFISQMEKEEIEIRYGDLMFFRFFVSRQHFEDSEISLQKDELLFLEEGVTYLYLHVAGDMYDVPHNPWWPLELSDPAVEGYTRGKYFLDE